MGAVGSSEHHYLPTRLYGVTFQMTEIFRHISSTGNSTAINLITHQADQ